MARRTEETGREPFYPGNDPAAPRRHPADKGDGPGSNRARAALTAGRERESAPAAWPIHGGGECNLADAHRPRPGDRARSISPPGSLTPVPHLVATQAEARSPCVRRFAPPPRASQCRQSAEVTSTEVTTSTGSTTHRRPRFGAAILLSRLSPQRLRGHGQSRRNRLCRPPSCSASCHYLGVRPVKSI